MANRLFRTSNTTLIGILHESGISPFTTEGQSDEPSDFPPTFVYKATPALQFVLGSLSSAQTLDIGSWGLQDRTEGGSR